MEEINRHYYAFISYSHKDKVDVLAFHQFLEHYQLPKPIRAQVPDAPKKFEPVFIDRDNLAGSVLNDRLRLALRNTDFLIVMCSPASAQSSYVNDEVSYFISLGKGDHIIPYILRGVPNSQDPEKECFGPALRELNPLGSDVHDLGRKKAKLRVIASMLGIDLDLLVQKEKHRTIRRVIAGTVAAACVAGFVWGQYDYYKVPKTSYYQDYIEVNGVPEGLGKALNREARKNMLGSYGITKLAGQVKALTYVNNTGKADKPQVTTDKDEYPIREYTYNDDNNLTQVAMKDESGKTLATWEYSNNGKEVSLRSASGDSVSLENFKLLVSEKDMENDQTNGISGYRMVYEDSTGWLQKKMYMSNAGSQTSVPDDRGTYGREYEYTDDGRIYRVYYLNQRGARTTLPSGAAYLEYTYDDQGRVRTQTYYDTLGNLAIGNESIAQLQTEYDGTSIIYSGYDCDGNPAVIESLGTEQYIAVYNQNGELLENAYYMDGHLKTSTLGYAKCTMEYDSEGHQSRVSFWGEEDEPVSMGGYCSRTEEYSTENGQTTVIQTYYDANGDITNGDEGYAILKQVTDEAGNVLLAEYYDKDNNPAAGPNGCFRVEATISDAGQETGQYYFDGEGNPYPIDGCYASKTRTYNQDGNCTDIYYADAAGQAVCNAKGYARIHYEYDSWGDIIDVSFYDTNDSPVIGTDGFAEAEYGFDDNGNLSSAAFFDDAGNAMANEDDIHRIEYKYDNGRIAEVSYYGTDGEPMLKNGVFKIVMERDTAGNVLSLRHLGKHSEPATCEDGFYMYEKEYDDNGHMISCRYRDEDGNLTPNKDMDGIAALEYVYENGQKVQRTTWKLLDNGIFKVTTVDLIREVTLSVEYYDAEEEPTTNDGVLKKEYEYDENGELSQQIIWKQLDDGMVQKTTYDVIKGVLVSSEYFNADGTPALKDSAHKVEFFFDDAGELTGYITYGIDGEVLASEGRFF